MLRFQVSTGETRSVIFYWHIIHAIEQIKTGTKRCNFAQHSFI